MAKIIIYKLLSAEVNRSTEEEPNVEQVLSPVKIVCETQAQYNANYPIAEKEAVPGTITVEGEFDGETETTLETRVEMLETDTADIAEALDMILSGVTE